MKPNFKDPHSFSRPNQSLVKFTTSNSQNLKLNTHSFSHFERILEQNEETSFDSPQKEETTRINDEKERNSSKSNQHQLIRKYENLLHQSVTEISRLNDLLSVREAQVSSLSNSHRNISENLAMLQESISQLQLRNSQLKRNNEEKQKLLLEVNSKYPSNNSNERIQFKEEGYISELEKQNHELRHRFREEKKKNEDMNWQFCVMQQKISQLEAFKSSCQCQLGLDFLPIQNSKSVIEKKDLDIESTLQNQQNKMTLINQRKPRVENSTNETTSNPLKYNNLELESLIGEEKISFNLGKDERRKLLERK